MVAFSLYYDDSDMKHLRLGNARQFGHADDESDSSTSSGFDIVEPDTNVNLMFVEAIFHYICVKHMFQSDARARLQSLLRIVAAKLWFELDIIPLIIRTKYGP